MALPIAPPPTSKDVAVLDWAGITVRITWTLLRLGVRVHREVLDDARQHVLFHVDAEMSAAVAEDLAEHLTEGFVARARGQRHVDPFVGDWAMPLSPRWQQAVVQSLDPVTALVFRKHYGDNRSLTRLQSSGGLDRMELQGAQAGLREIVRRMGTADGLPMGDWPDERVDRLLRRLAAYAPGPCPRPRDVIEGCYRPHVRGCARCDRLARLVQSEILDAQVLMPPSVGARPRGRAHVLALQVHPSAHRHRSVLAAELPGPVFPMGDDWLLLDARHLDENLEVLQTAAEVEAPPAEHLRGMIVEGRGAWGRHGLLGPLPSRILESEDTLAWGHVSGWGPLPDPLPLPPSDRPLWMGVLVLGVVAAIVLALARTVPAAGPASPLDASFTPGRGGVWAAFDAPETTWVSVVAETDDGLDLVLYSHAAADKVMFAVGDGTYRVHVAGQGLLLAAHAGPIPDLEVQVEAASHSPTPLRTLADTLALDADVAYRERLRSPAE